MSKILIDEATVKLALEELEGMQNAIYNIGGEHVIDLNYAVEKADVAEQPITALREALASEAKEQPAQVPVTDNTYGYAKSLAEAIFKQHFASDGHYASGRIVWGVNDTVIGILTQIDNMVADMVRRPAQQEPVAYDKTELNCFAQDLYDQKMREGKRGHYESMFHVIHQCIKKVAPPQPAQQTCNCRWEGEVQVQECTLHQSHLLVIHEWAGRAKAAEAKLAEQPAHQEPVAWRNAALRVGEDLCSVGPFRYYDMTAEQWLDWALSVVTFHTPLTQRKPLTRATIADARDYLNTNDKAMWVLGWNECAEAHNIKENT